MLSLADVAWPSKNINRLFDMVPLTMFCLSNSSNCMTAMNRLAELHILEEKQIFAIRHMIYRKKDLFGYQFRDFVYQQVQI